ncbi:MAG: hypothetical protein M3439_08535 [Chloroflexota bacterium]|nr:hypothetical protein [Chloroflexota bacterium]
MADEARVTQEDVRAITRLASLNLSVDRRGQLVTTLSAYLENMDRLRQLDVGDYEPPAITYEREAR